MTYTPIAPGTTSWDVPLNAALTSQDAAITVNAANITTNTASIVALNNGNMLPSDYGLIAWTMDPSEAANTQVLTNNTIHMAKIKILSSTIVSNICIPVATAGATLTAGQNFAGIYDAGGTLLGETADQSAVWTSTGNKIMPLTAAFTAIPGYYYIALLSNGTTPPAIVRENNTSAGTDQVINFNLTADTARSATAGTGIALPASITMSSRTMTAQSWWMAVS